MELPLMATWTAATSHPQCGGILYPEQNLRNTEGKNSASAVAMSVDLLITSRQGFYNLKIIQSKLF
jgi:hypothetical protein